MKSGTYCKCRAARAFTAEPRKPPSSLQTKNFIYCVLRFLKFHTWNKCNHRYTICDTRVPNFYSIAA